MSTKDRKAACKAYQLESRSLVRGVAITIGGVVDESRSAHAARVDAVGAKAAGVASPSASATSTSLCEIASTSLCEIAMARSSPVW